MVDGLAAPNPFQNRRVPVLDIWWDEHADWPAYNLLGGIAEEPLGAGIPGGNYAVKILAHDRVVGGRDDRPQPGLDYIRLPPLSDVAEDKHHPFDFPSLSLIGAPLSSIGRSVPSLEIKRVWLAKPTTMFSRSTRVTGFSATVRVSSAIIRKTVARGFPAASSGSHP